MGFEEGQVQDVQGSMNQKERTHNIPLKTHVDKIILVTVAVYVFDEDIEKGDRG